MASQYRKTVPNKHGSLQSCFSARLGQSRQKTGLQVAWYPVRRKQVYNMAWKRRKPALVELIAPWSGDEALLLPPVGREQDEALQGEGMVILRRASDRVPTWWADDRFDFAFLGPVVSVCGCLFSLGRFCKRRADEARRMWLSPLGEVDYVHENSRGTMFRSLAQQPDGLGCRLKGISSGNRADVPRPMCPCSCGSLQQGRKSCGGGWKLDHGSRAHSASPRFHLSIRIQRARTPASNETGYS